MRNQFDGCPTPPVAAFGNGGDIGSVIGARFRQRCEMTPLPVSVMMLLDKLAAAEEDAGAPRSPARAGSDMKRPPA